MDQSAVLGQYSRRYFAFAGVGPGKLALQQQLIHMRATTAITANKQQKTGGDGESE
jgi:hypothetical protein